MKFESEKLSKRFSDGTIYASILADVNRVVYDNFINYIPFINEINFYKFNSFIKNESLKILNSRDIHEKIIPIYINNKEFFKKKYSIDEKSIKQLSSNLLIGNFILEKIIDDLELNKAPKINELYINEIFGGVNNTNIVDCPTIVQNSYTNIPYELDAYGKINYDFFFQQANNFDVKITSLGNTIVFDKTSVNKYFFEKNYVDKVIANNNLTNFGFHFEKFVCFDFDQQNFISELNDKALLTQESVNGKYIDFLTFYYSCLNLGFFLSENAKVKDIIVSQEYFKKVLLLSGVNSASAIAESQFESLKKYFPKFITNLRLGLRLVCRQSIFANDFVEINKNIKLSYSSEEQYGANIKLQKLLNLIVRNQKFAPTLPVQGTLTYDVVKPFSSLEYNIIKNKSHILHTSAPNGNLFAYVWHPIVSVFSPTSLEDLVEFSDFFIIDDLKKQIIKTDEFKYVFSKLIPMNDMSIIQKTNTASKIQNFLNQNLDNPNNNNETRIAKSLKNTLLNTTDILLKDDKEY